MKEMQTESIGGHLFYNLFLQGPRDMPPWGPEIFSFSWGQFSAKNLQNRSPIWEIGVDPPAGKSWKSATGEGRGHIHNGHRTLTALWLN